MSLSLLLSFPPPLLALTKNVLLVEDNVISSVQLNDAKSHQEIGILFRESEQTLVPFFGTI